MVLTRRIKRVFWVAACPLIVLLPATASRAQDKGHGIAVSARARSACTAKNPHNSHARPNHGMCVSAFAKKNAKGKQHGHGKGKAQHGADSAAQPEATEAPEPSAQPDATEAPEPTDTSGD